MRTDRKNDLMICCKIRDDLHGQIDLVAGSMARTDTTHRTDPFHLTSASFFGACLQMHIQCSAPAHGCGTYCHPAKYISLLADCLSVKYSCLLAW
uniref:Uncharacterized protein n=1 Tax=Arundo donax TaxID=35708 RepID=A0A0A9ATR4_ARUDO